MNLLEIFNNNDDIMDYSIKIIQEANNQGFNGFSGYCGQAALLINECLFNDTQQIFAAFNEALNNKNHHIGHVACIVDLPDGFYFILDADAQIKSIEDIQHWGMLDSQDNDYISLFKQHNIPLTEDNFENISELILTSSFILEHFNCQHLQEQRKILNNAIQSVLSPVISSQKKFKIK